MRTSLLLLLYSVAWSDILLFVLYLHNIYTCMILLPYAAPVSAKGLYREKQSSEVYF